MIGRPISELKEGQTAELTRIVTLRMIQDFARTIGDANPLHDDPAFAASVGFTQPIAPGILAAGMISAAIGTLLPGPGTLYMSQDLKFLKPVFPDDEITTRVEVVELIADRNRVHLKTVCTNQRGEDVLTGDAWVKPPKERIVYDETAERWSARPVTPVALAAFGVQMWSNAAHALLSGLQRSIT